MTKLGWGILIGIVVVVGSFLSVLSFSSAPPGSVRERVRQRAARVLPIVRPRAGALVVPVRGIPPNGIVPSWGDPRGGGTRAHEGTDIAAPAGTAVVAAASGTVEKLFESGAGGTTLYVRSPDRRTSFYYAHLGGYAPGMREGLRLRAGETIGYVGDTGNAGAGNYHLHFGISRMRPGDGWWQGEPVDPYPMLARAGVAR